MKLLSELDSLDKIKDGITRKLPTKTSQLANDSGFLTSVGDFVDLTTAQTIAGTKTFSDNLKLSKKLYVGTMRTIYNAGAENSDFLGSLFFGNGGSYLSYDPELLPEQTETGKYNTSIGYNTLSNLSTDGYQTAIGAYALNKFTHRGTFGGGFINSNVANTAVGYSALREMVNGVGNSVIGSHSLGSVTNGFGNIAMGDFAGFYIANGATTNKTPDRSIYIGNLTKALADNQTNQIVIGFDTTGHGSNTATIGNTSITDNYFNGNLHLTGALKNATNTFTLPSSTGTLALTSDIPSVSDFLVASNIKAGTNITLSVSGKDVTINSTGGATVTVVDNLTSTSTTSALSAKQGKVLNDNLATKAVQPYIQRSYSGGNGVRLIGTYNYSTSVGDTRPLFYMAGKQGHGNGTSYLWQGEFIFGVSTTGVVTAKAILKVSDGTFGKFYYRHDTTNKILYLYIYTGQYSSAYFSDLIQINAGNYSSYFTLSPAGSVTTDTIIEGVNILYPASGGTIALTSQIPSNSSFTLAGLSEKSYNSLTDKPTIPIIGSMEATFIADMYISDDASPGTSFGAISFSFRGLAYYDANTNKGVYVGNLYAIRSGSGNRWNDVATVSLLNLRDASANYRYWKVGGALFHSESFGDGNEAGTLFWHPSFSAHGGIITTLPPSSRNAYYRAEEPAKDWALNETSYITIFNVIITE